MNTVQHKVKDQLFEFVEFQVGNSHFGIAIHLVREIIEPVPVTVLPHAHPYIEGIIQLRGEVLPVIDLKKVTNSMVDESEMASKYIVAELAGKTVVLDVTAVVHIHRIDHSEIEVATNIYAGEKVHVTGVIKREDGMILLIDFEKMISDNFM